MYRSIGLVCVVDKIRTSFTGNIHVGTGMFKMYRVCHVTQLDQAFRELSIWSSSLDRGVVQVDRLKLNMKVSRCEQACHSIAKRRSFPTSRKLYRFISDASDENFV